MNFSGRRGMGQSTVSRGVSGSVRIQLLHFSSSLALQQDRLIISDPVAIQYILNTTNFDHAPIFRHTIYLAEGGQSLSYVQGTVIHPNNTLMI
jgi:hypothetical protein